MQLVKTLSIVAFGVLLAGCGGSDRETAVIETRIQHCPTSKPVSAVCPALPSLGTTVSREQVEDWVLSVRPVHVSCRQAVRLWERTWQACIDASDR